MAYRELCRTSLRAAILAALTSSFFLPACGSDDAATPVASGHKKDAGGSSADPSTADDSGDSADSDPPPASKADASVGKVDASVKKLDAGAATPSSSDGGTPKEDDGKSSGDGGSGTDASGGPAQHADLGKGDGHDVICIGDSWMSLAGTGIQQSLVKTSGQKYRTFGVPGTKLLDGVIPNQYESAKRANPDIKTVVMTGGGNDLLLGTGATSDTDTIDKVAVRLDALWTEMGKDGVQDVVYIEYSEGGTNGPNVQYGIKTVGPVCTNHKAVRCHFLLSDPIIMMMLRDGIHPTDAGFDKIGKAVFELMNKEGMRR